ncbi:MULTISPECIES: FAD-dependent monooxygenase [Streptomyces]|uniref:Hydroxylase n=2 Tax=Streptomyces avermitilis TaxID=33903 RepID=Q79ZK4_STRAW|nr:FAD-dependent monooxygenase [Streptomyces avermitilis]BAB69178.1 putative hydroxylase [Streptomyces avermitilis]BAC68844.1 putative hydroxylase [Streptomyces avermitilis MA-4680 = NBRC 14893]BBJ48773.1 FAD-binding monooxygenase [Streptomyces avermitilis]GDY60811.1 FAD-binding monooxygenase [Streptomyces avermitilis]GDY79114.1 FAD-binding monooxygenase [Streptomyces avermitilis]
MKIACVGGGPASLYFSILMKRQDPSHDITVHERNPAGSTYGWGVTYWSGLLDKLRGSDPESALAVSENSVRWSDGVAHVRNRTTVHHGDEGFGIGRRRFLDVLADRARSLGVRIEYEHEIGADDPLPEADLVVAGDGVNSVLRGRYADHFGSETVLGRNRYIWLGTTKVFDSFTFAFVESEHGWIWCYGYGFSDGHSTCVIECSPETWTGLGLDRASEADGLALLEKLFADVLDGHELIGRAQSDGAAQWLNFRTLTNRTWHRDNLVLIGDAAHTTHYSIGAGTTLALEDAIALAEALSAHRDLPGALAAYERERKSALLHIQSAARLSAQWYENLPRYIRLPPPQMFALLGQRHSPLLPYVPPQLYYRIDRAAGQLEALRRLKRWLGPRLARTVQARTGR